MATAKSPLTRVTDLAKELNINPKEILAWLEQEGIQAKDTKTKQMKPYTGFTGMPLGLVDTVRTEFQDRAPSAGAPIDTGTDAGAEVAVEADSKPKAPAKAARAKPEAKAETKAEPKAETKSDALPVAPVAQPQEQAVAPVPTPAAAPAAEEVPQAHVKAKARPHTEDEPPATPAVPAKPVAPRPRPRPAPMGVQNVPVRPTNIKPIGEQLVTPIKRAMRGPQVVRIEAAENVPAPRSRTRPGETGGNAGDSKRPERPTTGVARSTGPVRGGGVKGKAQGPVEDEAGKRRSLSSRRGRGDAAVLSGPARLSQADVDALNDRIKGASTFGRSRRKNIGKGGSHFQMQSPATVGGKVAIEEPITIKALSAATGIKAAACVKFLFKQGVMATVNSTIDTEAAMEIAMDHNIELEVKAHQTAAAKVEQEFANRERSDVKPRPPVVTILGHVDHGKTSLLDRIRKADVAAHEAGGITQHVGAYRVSVEGSDGELKTVVFLDTPGHAAFTSMRSRGAKITDVVVLLVAAEDGLMPQTIESIAHAKAAKVPVVVALNKIDMVPPQHRDALLQRIYGELAQHGLNASAWGGDTEVCMVSAKTGEGVPELLEILELQSGVLGLSADYAGPARGTVIESEMQPGRGAVARVLVQEGNIRVGDFFVAGRSFGRVRGMMDSLGRSVKEAGPATPVEVSGIDEVPDAGDKFYVTDSLKKAEEIAQQCREDERTQQLARETKVTLDNFAATLKAGETKNLNLVLKADVQGSVETIQKTLEQLGNDEVRIRVLHAGVGVVTENDILLADASDAVVLGFHTTISPAVRDIAEARHVEVRAYRIIYELLDDMKLALEGMLAPDIREEETGRAEVKEAFRIGKIGMVAGSIIVSGAATKKDVKVRLLRDGAVVTENRSVEALRRHKDDVAEVRAGTECGIRIANFEDIKPGDVIVFYKVVETARKLD